MKANLLTMHRLYLILSAASLLIFAANIRAVTFTVIFGGDAGYAYSPKTLSAMVGDTIQWQGSFAQHPLSSTTIPANTASWRSETGTNFVYLITQPGTYNYRCDLHPGMIGSFQASSAAGVRNQATGNASSSTRLSMSIITGHNGTFAKFSAHRPTALMIEVVNAQGRNLLSTRQSVPSGESSVALDPMIQTNGFYIVRIVGQDAVMTRPVFVTKG
jgi:plastocyanin